MEVQKRFEEMLVPVSRKIKKECNHSSNNCNDESFFARLSFDLIRKELMEALQIIAIINPTIKDWERIRENSRVFFNEQINMLKNDFSMLMEEDDINDSEANLLKKEIFAEYNTFIDGQLRIIADGRKKILYDLLIKITSGIIGGLIVYFLTRSLM
ncbi:MAG: hypothetical protein Q7J85_06490 [Bacillota bacterium]|nr:hypothetical protein [Bacillota bacterium]